MGVVGGIQFVSSRTERGSSHCDKGWTTRQFGRQIERQIGREALRQEVDYGCVRPTALSNGMLQLLQQGWKIVGAQ